MLNQLKYSTRQKHGLPSLFHSKRCALKEMRQANSIHQAEKFKKKGYLWASTLLLTASLAACGGGDAVQPETTQPPPPNSSHIEEKRTLLINLDGVTYEMLKNGIEMGILPNLATLQPQLAYSGGIVNTVAQQPNLDAPSWATILTGTWAVRHRVYAVSSGQKLAAPSIFSLLKTIDTTNRNGAVVASEQLATLLASEKQEGHLDQLENCSVISASDDCVTKAGAEMIRDGSLSIVFAQYHTAQDLALYPGLKSTKYAEELVKLDAAIGALIAETTQNAQSQWLILVTGGHGLNGNGKADGLWQVPQSATFIGSNQILNTDEKNGMSDLPFQLQNIYAYPSIADITPTILAHEEIESEVETYDMDGGQLIGDEAVANFIAKVQDNATTHPSVVLSWQSTPNQIVTILRDGKKIAELPADTTTYIDDLSHQNLKEGVKYQFNYVAVTGKAAKSVLTTNISFIQGTPLAPTVTQGLQVYYSFGQDPQSTLPVDKMGNSSLGPWDSDANGGSSTADPLGGLGLLIDPNIATPQGYDSYKLTPKTRELDVVNAAADNNGAFTIGFWFKAPLCSADKKGRPVFSNKTDYAKSGKTEGILISTFGCGFDFNLADGKNRVDTDNPYIAFSENQWVYLAMVADIATQSMTAYVFDPISGTKVRNLSLSNISNIRKIAGVNTNEEIGFGLGQDGSGRFYMNKNKGTPGSYDPSKNNTTLARSIAFADLAMWDRALTEDELSSIFKSQAPLSSLFNQ